MVRPQSRRDFVLLLPANSLAGEWAGYPLKAPPPCAGTGRGGTLRGVALTGGADNRMGGDGFEG